MEVTPLPFPVSSREYRSRFTSEETLMFCMRVMVGVIILYDHVHPVGAFCKTSKIDVRTVMIGDFPIGSCECHQTDLASLSPSSPSTHHQLPMSEFCWLQIHQGSSPLSKKSSPVHGLTANAFNLKGTEEEWRCWFPQPVEGLRGEQSLSAYPCAMCMFICIYVSQCEKHQEITGLQNTMVKSQTTFRLPVP